LEKKILFYEDFYRMIYRDYGKTGKKVSVLGFGGMRFKEGEPKEKSAEVVIRAVELGVNYLDTAPFYCHDRSEDILGIAIKQIKQPFFISTKCSENNGDKVRKSLERSLKRLHVDKIDFFHFWCVLNMDRFEKAKKGGAIEAFLKAKEEGLIDHVVISSHQPSDEIREVVKMGIFEGITLGYNVVNFPFRREGLLAAHEAGMGIVTMNPLYGGIIPQNEKKFSFIKEDEKFSATASALRFNMAHPEISVVLSGMDSIEEVETNVASVENLPTLTKKRIKELEKFIENSLDHLCTGCSYCLPCEDDIPIPKFMDVYNQYVFQKTPESVKIRLNLHWGIDISILDNCSECRACEDACTQHLPILERFEELKEIVKKQKR
jgi:predicted aldo/keto reductase-like oxidoreductase